MKKKQIFILSVLITLLTHQQSAIAGEWQDPVTKVWYQYENDPETDGYYAWVYCGKDGYINKNVSGHITIRSEIEIGGKKYKVKSLAPEAFHCAGKLTSVSIPSSVESIGNWAFLGCTSLKTVNIPPAVTAIKDKVFQGCSSLDSIIIHNSIVSIGNEAFSGCTSLTSIVIPNSVTQIGSFAFNKCTRLSNIKLSNSITSIEPHTFQGCTNLKTLNIPKSVTTIGDCAFCDCEGLKIDISNSITTIGQHVFENGKNLTVSIPNSIKSLGAYTFKGCSNLSVNVNLTKIDGGLFYECISVNSISFGDSVRILGNNALGHECFDRFTSFDIPNSVTFLDNHCLPRKITSLTIPHSVETISSSCCTNYDSLKTVTIDNASCTIGSQAFLYCTNLETVDLGNATINVGRGAFSSCYNLSKVTIRDNEKGNRITTISENAFGNCSKLTEINIGNCVRSIRNGAFNKCNNLQSVNISDLTAWCEIQFEGNYSNPLQITRHLFVNGEEVTNLVIPNSIKSIKNCTFMYCSDISSVTFPNGLVSIGDSAFYKCSGLTNIDMPNSVESIGSYTFADCNKINTVTIPHSVTTIGDNAFYYANISSISIGKSVKSIGKQAINSPFNQNVLKQVISHIEDPFPLNLLNSIFFSNSSCTLYVPEGTKAKYEENWKNISNIIEMTTTIEKTPIVIKKTSEQNKTAQVGIGTLLCPAVAMDTKGTITIPENYNSYNVNQIAQCAFYNCSKITNVILPNSVTIINRYAFYRCSSLSSITFPSTNIIVVGSYAFIHCTSLSRIDLSKNVRISGYNPFVYCTNLKEILIDKNNPYQKSKDGIVFNSGDDILIAYPCGRESTKYAVPRGTKIIDVAAFAGSNKLKQIDLPASVDSIGEYAFESVDLAIINSNIINPFVINDVFSNNTYTSATLYVPRGTKAKYQATDGWKNFTTIIETDFNDQPQGDLTGDEIVNGTDMVALVNVIMNGGNNPSADVNNDGQVNGTDMVALVNIIMKNDNARELMALGGEDETPAAVKSEDERISVANSGVKIGAEPIRTNGDGSLELTITLTNPQMDVTMVQMDVTLPEGLTLPIDDSTDMMAGRTSWHTHQIYSAASDDGRNVRLMLASGRNALIEGTEGGIIRLTLKADDTFTGGDIVLHDMLCTSPDLQEAWPADVVVRVGEATGISNVSRLNNNEQRTNGRTVYNLNGQRLNTQRKGVNIVNGRKVIR